MKSKKIVIAPSAKTKSSRKTQSSRSGLIFPVARFHRHLKNLPQSVKRISKGASVYMAAVIEYLTAEIIELGGNACKDNLHSRISPRHLLLAIAIDEELNKLLKRVIIPGGGVIPKISHELFPLKNDDKDVKSATKLRMKSAKSKTSLKNNSKILALNVSNAKTTKPKLTKIPSGTKSAGITVLSEKTLKSGQRILVVQADITDVVVDAIVHPTNNTFYLGGEVGSAISRKGGQPVRDIVTKIQTTHGNLPVGGVALSDAGTNMFCSKIIHCHSPNWDFQNQVSKINDLTNVVTNILSLADNSKLKTIALPSISSGGNGFPKQVAAQTILRGINGFFKSLDSSGTMNNSSVKDVYFVLYDSESVNIYTSELGKLE